MTNGTTSTFTVKNGAQGPKGDKGDTGGIQDVAASSTKGYIVVTNADGTTKNVPVGDPNALLTTGGTMTGNITMSGSELYSHSKSMTQTAPSSTTYYEPIQWFDKNNKRIGAIGTTSYANGDFATHIQVQREISGTNYYQQLYMIIDANGTGFCKTTKMYGAVWNDYAEFRQSDEVKPGYVVTEKGDDTLAVTTSRMMPACSIVSDTFGFAIGETEKCKTPLAMAGRVLAYPYEDRNSYKPGDAVCSAPDGKVSKMTQEEKVNHPECIIGYVSCVPGYDTWGEHDTKVDGRIWIKVV